MTDHDPAELDEREEVIVGLLGRYIERRETGAQPLAHDLLAAAAEFGDGAVDTLRRVLEFYEVTRTLDSPSESETGDNEEPSGTGARAKPPPEGGTP